MKSKIVWTKKEDSLLKSVYQKKMCDIVPYFPNRTRAAINQRASKLKLKKNKNYYLTSSCDFLLKNTHETFYWIGFILADGSFTKNRLKLTLAIKDEDHLKKLANKLNIKTSSYFVKLNSKKFKYCSLSCMDTLNIPVVIDKFDIKNQKTYNSPSSLGNFSDDLIMSIFIGLIDGDGSITNQSGRDDCSLRFHTHESWLSYYQQIAIFLKKKTGLKIKMPYIGKDGYMVWTIADHKVLFYLKKFVISNNIKILNRKWDKIDLDRKYKTDESDKLKDFIINNPNVRGRDIAKLFKIGDAAVSLCKKRLGVSKQNRY